MARQAKLTNAKRRSKSCPSRPFPRTTSMQWKSFCRASGRFSLGPI